MGTVDPLKVPSPVSMTSFESFRLNPNAVNISIPKIISYLPLVDFPHEIPTSKILLRYIQAR